MLIKDYVQYWYRLYRMPYQAETTRATYSSIIENHIVDTYFGQLEISDVKSQDIQQYLTNTMLYGNKAVYVKKQKVRNTSLSYHTMNKLRQIVVACFAQAVKDGIISKNIAANTSPIPLVWQDKPVFTPDMQHKFLESTKSHRFYTAYVMLFFLGCRRSELLGLAWDSVDLRKNTITIRQALVVVAGTPMLVSKTKTKTSNRVIPFPPAIKELLRKWKQQQIAESKLAGYSNEANLVFTNKDGSPHNPTYFSRNFKAMIKKLDCCPNSLHVHSVRHTWATNMIQCGIAITDVQALGGWSRPDTLLNIYAHTVKESQRKAVNKLYQLLNGDDK